MYLFFAPYRCLYRKLIHVMRRGTRMTISTCVTRMLVSYSRVVSVRGFSHSPEAFSGFWGLAEMRNVAVWQERVVRQGKPSHCCLFIKLWKGHGLSTYFSRFLSVSVWKDCSSCQFDFIANGKQMTEMIGTGKLKQNINIEIVLRALWVSWNPILYR